MKILSKWTRRFGSTLRIAQLALATTLSASLLHFSDAPIVDDLDVEAGARRTSRPASCTRWRRPARARCRLAWRARVPSRSRSTGVVSAAATTSSAPNAAASFSSLPTPFCGETKTHFSGYAIAVRSVSIAPSVS